MSRFSGVYPHGAIREHQEMIDLISEAKSDILEIMLYSVGQSGSLSGYVITPLSEYIINPEMEGSGEYKMCKGPGFNKVTCFATYGYEDRSQWLWYGNEAGGSLLMGSYNIGDLNDNGYGVHRLFTNKQHAKNYSNELKNDPEYIAETKAHHRRCDEWDSDYGQYDDYDF